MNEILDLKSRLALIQSQLHTLALEISHIRALVDTLNDIRPQERARETDSAPVA